MHEFTIKDEDMKRNKPQECHQKQQTTANSGPSNFTQRDYETYHTTRMSSEATDDSKFRPQAFHTTGL